MTIYNKLHGRKLSYTAKKIAEEIKIGATGMKKILISFIFVLNVLICFAKPTSQKSTIVSGKDFYFVNLAYKDYSSQLGNIFKQDKEKVDEYIEYLKSLKEKYPEPLSFEDLFMMPPFERYDYSMLEEYESVSEEEFRDKVFDDLTTYKFRITYGEKTVTVYMYIDNPSVRGGDAEYTFDYDGVLLNKEYGK